MVRGSQREEVSSLAKLVNWKRLSECPPFPGCPEVARDGDRILLRDSERPGTVVEMSLASWQAFAAGIKKGEFDF